MGITLNRIVEVVDGDDNNQPIYNTNLNGDPEHHRFYAQKDQSYQVWFK